MFVFSRVLNTACNYLIGLFSLFYFFPPELELGTILYLLHCQNLTNSRCSLFICGRTEREENTGAGAGGDDN